MASRAVSVRATLKHFVAPASAAPATVSTFNFKGFDLRCVLIDDQPWFAATDVCAALGVGNASKATSKLTSSEVSRWKLSTATHARPNNIVNEAGR